MYHISIYICVYHFSILLLSSFFKYYDKCFRIPYKTIVSYFPSVLSNRKGEDAKDSGATYGAKNGGKVFERAIAATCTISLIHTI